jgi:hypothetical protein
MECHEGDRFKQRRIKMFGLKTGVSAMGVLVAVAASTSRGCVSRPRAISCVSLIGENFNIRIFDRD